MNIREEILDQFGDDAHTMLFADGFDDAIVESLMKQGMDYAEALEHYDFNIAGAYVGEQTPIFMHKIERHTK